LLAKHKESIKSSVRAIAEIDVIMAKAKLGEAINGVIPEVRIKD
jgi:dsDNA-specific endonuclease/ATPase MutS2